MAENTQRSIGRPNEYKFDRGGFPAEMGPYIGIVVNNVDNTRQGRLQVWIEQFGKTQQDGSPDLSDESVWRTVRYISPFYGATSVEFEGSARNDDKNYKQVQKSYGFWMVPPDIGSTVMVLFIDGDINQGYWFGCVADQYQNQMILDTK